MLYFNLETCSWTFFLFVCFFGLSYIKLKKSNQKIAICIWKKNQVFFSYIFKIKF